MRNPKDFFKPLAAGAPEPLREIPFRPSRMIHFFPPHLEKVTAKLPEIAPTVDVLLGNLEDAIPMDAKEAAREGLVRVAKTVPMGDTQLWKWACGGHSAPSVVFGCRRPCAHARVPRAALAVVVSLRLRATNLMAESPQNCGIALLVGV